jgi:hypothetical protein
VEDCHFKGFVSDEGKYFESASTRIVLQIYANDRKKVASDKKTLD